MGIGLLGTKTRRFKDSKERVIPESIAELREKYKGKGKQHAL